jgi:hypothetical protein
MLGSSKPAIVARRGRHREHRNVDSGSTIESDFAADLLRM